MNDIVDRLIAYRPENEWGDKVHHTICTEAAGEIQSLRRALRAFAAVAKHDISMDEDNQDMFRPMLAHNRAPRLTVGDFRAAFNAFGDDDAL